MASNLGHGVHIDAGEIVQSTEWRRATRHMAFVSVAVCVSLLMLDDRWCSMTRQPARLRSLSMPGLVAIIYYSVAGGPFGTEDVISAAGRLVLGTEGAGLDPEAVDVFAHAAHDSPGAERGLVALHTPFSLPRLTCGQVWWGLATAGGLICVKGGHGRHKALPVRPAIHDEIFCSSAWGSGVGQARFTSLARHSSKPVRKQKMRRPADDCALPGHGGPLLAGPPVGTTSAVSWPSALRYATPTGGAVRSETGRALMLRKILKKE
ncbi:hypothetical protein AK812_SmicGene21238 [Symbiodinium microadriaticum]|uniref:Uncharacterized protein n=1 Tax=Symbiodinium microadriaticum TaxID=2951 RepID=A0A1Q9DMV8_SYMMI|nr:hypothetical protein AK812_SmicGene21238 [Symbiodinium microadriaticum]